MPKAIVYAELIGPGSFPTVCVGECVVQRNDWGQLQAFVPALKKWRDFNNAGYIQLNQYQIEQVQGKGQ